MPAPIPFRTRSVRSSNAAADPGQVRRDVRDALTHLHDTPYLQTHPLARYANPDSASTNAGCALRRALLAAIQSLRPGPEVSTGSLAFRSYNILRLRYVEDLPVSQCLERLALSKSVYYAGQQRAVDEVASVLVRGWGFHSRSQPVGETHDVPSTDADSIAARAQEMRAPGAVPSFRTSFVGREREMAEVARLLATTRLVTLTGVGGCGKTRLSIEASTRLLDAFADGVWFLSLAALTDPGLVPQAAASALGLQDGPGTDTIARYIGGRQALLLLDNCEHLLDACANLADKLLRGCPRLTILATSRQPLGVEGETTLRVPSLPIPRLGSSPESLSACESVRLFLDRARSVAPGFSLSARNAPSVAAICRRLDGIPLAVELAAAQVRVLSTEQIASRLRRDFRLVSGGNRAAMPRQQTLKATLDWSHNLLSEPERRLFRRLSVFAESFSIDAAEAVCKGGGGDGIEETDVMQLLTRLVDKSLVEVVMGEEVARYRLLEPVRHYARERLGEADEVAMAQDRHLDWCLDLARQAESELAGPRQRDWLARLEQEHANLRAALSWAHEANVDAGLELSGRLTDFWDRQCYYREGYHWLMEFLRLTSERADQAARARALRGAGWLAGTAMADGNQSAVRLLEESLALSRELCDKRQTAETLIRFTRGADLDATGALVDEAAALAQELGDDHLLGHARFWQAARADSRGDSRLARTLAEESLALFQRVGDPLRAAFAGLVLGNLLAREDERVEARRLLEEALETLREERQTFGTFSATWALARLAIDEGEHDRALRLLGESVMPGRAVSWPDQRPYFLCLAGVRECDRGRLERGVRLIGAADTAIPGLPEPFVTDGEAGIPSVGQHAVEAARRDLGEETFGRAWAEGRKMTVEQAVEYALSSG